MRLVMSVSSGETPHRRSCRTTLRRSLVTSPDVLRDSRCDPTSVSRTEIWYGEAPIPPPGSTPDPTLTEARWAVLREYTGGLSRTISAAPRIRSITESSERLTSRGSWITSSHEFRHRGAAPPESVTRPWDLRSLISRWERFWFAEVPSEAMALVRIAVGMAGLVNLIGFTPVDQFWMLDGLAPLPGGGLGLRAYLIESGLGAAAGWTFFITLPLRSRA